MPIVLCNFDALHIDYTATEIKSLFEHDDVTNNLLVKNNQRPDIFKWMFFTLNPYLCVVVVTVHSY